MSKFQKSIQKTAKSVDEAIKMALAELGVMADEAIVEIIEEGSRGFLGFGTKEAKVVATVKDIPALNAKNFLSDIFEAMKLDVTIDAHTNDNSLDINLKGDDMGIVIGKRGDTLDSIQYLTSLIVNQESESYVRVSVDTENYREKRTDALLALSQRLADKVTKSGKKYTLEPMNPYERRVIHSNLQNNENVTTYSIGDDPYRKVVISPKNAKTYPKTGYASKQKTSGTNFGYKKNEEINQTINETIEE